MKQVKLLFLLGLLLISRVLLPESPSSSSESCFSQHDLILKKEMIKKRWQHCAILASGGSKAYGDFYTCDAIKKYSDYLGTQSWNHYKKNDDIQFNVPGSEFFMTQDFIKKCLRKERVLQGAGYVTFYHGQAADKYMPIKLDTLLYSIRTGRATDNFLLLHTKEDPLFDALRTIKDGDSKDAVLSAVLDKESQTRTRLLSGPRSDNYSEDRPFYLFLNDSLAGNCTKYADPGCSSFRYFRANANCGNSYREIKNDAQAIFDNHGYGQVAAEFLAEFEQLQQDYLKLSRFGTLYIIGVPKDTVHLSVVPARAFGYIQPLKVDGQETTDMRKIAAALLTDSYVEPADQKEYVAIMTHDEHGWLNPASGIKVFPMIIATSEEKRAEFELKWLDFEARLRARIAELKIVAVVREKIKWRKAE